VPIENGGTNATSIVGAKENLLLNNVDNTGCIKPISTATSDALLLKKEDLLNKSTDGKFLSNSDEKYPLRAKKTYIDAAVASGVVDASQKEKGRN
jgi:hypothetical protein